MIRWAGRTLALAGALLLAYCGLVWLEGAAFRAYALQHPPRARKAALHSAIGILQIPRLGLSTVVVEGDDSQALRLGAGHIPGTALPGEPGNVVLAGHRDTVFRGLRNLVPGDRIVLITAQGSFVYQADGVRVTSPDDVGVLRPAARTDLTLITCYPFSYFGSAPRRFIVRAHRLVADQVHWRQSASWPVQKQGLGSASQHVGAPSWLSSSVLAACWPF